MEMRFKLWSASLQDTIQFRRDWKSEAHGSNLAYNDLPGPEVVFSFLFVFCFFVLIFKLVANIKNSKILNENLKIQVFLTIW